MFFPKALARLARRALCFLIVFSTNEEQAARAGPPLLVLPPGNNLDLVFQKARQAMPHPDRMLVTIRQAIRGFRVTPGRRGRDRKSTRLNSSHSQSSYAVFCLKK